MEGRLDASPLNVQVYCAPIRERPEMNMLEGRRRGVGGKGGRIKEGDLNDKNSSVYGAFQEKNKS